MPIWLGDRRGALTDWTTQQWVKLTGRRITLEQLPWLHGPIGRPTGIGSSYFDELAAERGFEVRRGGKVRGLVADLDLLRGPAFNPADVAPSVRAFYEQTSEYELEAWSEWCGAFRPFGSLLAWLFSRRLQQLNVPLRSLDTSRGTTSEVLHLVDPRSGELALTAWLRKLRQTGNVLYAGTYGVAQVPGHRGPCLRVVFPLPRGNGIVLLRPEADADGVLTVTSAGARFGDPGFYFTVHRGEDRVWARYVRTMRESIRVYPADGNDVRADHTMWLWGRVFMRLHYLMRRKPEQ
jgi:hypothetical protein